MPLTTGTRLGPYEILGPLGAGGMGEVYRARDPRIGRDVAIKVLPREVASNPEWLRRFEQEARATGALNHPNLLALYDVGSSETGPFLVAELLEGETLRARLRGGPAPLNRAVDWTRQICAGLSAAHERGIVHRDLKPENVFLVRDGRVKILDFGLAKIGLAAGSGGPDAVTAAAPTSAGVTLGTVGYMAPEQVRGEAAGPAADVFALGAVLYEIVTGRPAFREKTTVETLHAILNGEPAPLAKAGRSIPPALERVIGRCLEKDPAQRFRSPADIAFALEAIVPQASAAAPATAAAGLRAWLAGGIGLLLLAIPALWLATRGRPVEVAPTVPAAAPRMNPFLSSDAIEKEPAWSPTGDFLAYASDAAGNDDIWIADPSGGNPVNLSGSFAGVDAWPAWSPDGRSLAFYSERDGGGIYTMTALGANVRRVVSIKPGVLYTFSLSWAHDGNIVYTGFDTTGHKQIYRVPPAGGDPACLTCDTEPYEGRAGELSPSGRQLAFLSGLVGSRASLYVKDLASGRVSEVTNRADAPHWSADGRIVFVSNRDGQADLWEVAVDPRTGERTGEPRRLTSALGATTFALSPDGRQVLAVKENSRSHLWTFPLSLSVVTDLARGTALTSGEVNDRRSRWSGDGSQMFFESTRRGSIDIWRLRAGGEVSRVTTAPGGELRPRPSPKGDWVAFDAVEARGEFTQLMRTDGTEVHAIDERWFTSYRNVCCVDWSPDGTRLAVTVSGRPSDRSPDASSIGVISIDRASGKGGPMRVLTLPGGTPQYPRWSPDGRFIVYEAVVDGSWDLWIVNPDAPEPRRVTTFPGNERQAAWQKSPLAIVFHRDYKAIWRMPFGPDGTPSGPAERWFVPPDRHLLAADSLDVSPPGDRLMLTLVSPASDIWLVEFGK